MIFNHTHYPSYLRAVLAERRGTNRSYSLRAFARDLGVNASQLSNVLKGRKGLSLPAATKVARRLGLDERASQYLQIMVLAQQSRTPEVKEGFLSQLRLFNPGRP